MRGLPLPSLGSPQDVYLQKVMLREMERDFTREAFQAYATWATGSGEGAKRFGEMASETYGKLVKLFFPHIRIASEEDNQKAQIEIVKRMFAHHGVEVPPEYREEPDGPEPPPRKGFWRSMLEKVTGKGDAGDT